MVRRIFGPALAGVGLALLGLAVYVAVAVPTASAITNCDTTEAGITASEQQMLTLINGARAQVNLPALKLSNALNRASAWKSADPSATGSGGVPFSHTDSLGRSPVQRAKDCGYPPGAAENIAYGSSDPTFIFNLWMGSSGHRGNINGTNLDGSINATYFQYAKGYVVVGIGQHGGAWTTDFGYMDDSGTADPPPSSGTTIPPTNTHPGSASSTPVSTNTPLPTNTPQPTATATPAVQRSGVTMSLSPGMNLVTFAGPLQPIDSGISSLGGLLVGVYGWDGSNNHWDRFAPGAPGYANTLSILEPGRVYYIELSGNAVWSY